MEPGALVFTCQGSDLHQHVTEGLAPRDSIDGIAVGGHHMIVAIAQGKALGIGLGIGTQIADPLDAVHGQRCVIGPENALVGVEHNHPVGQTGDDLLQLAAVGFGGQDVLAHYNSTWAKGL
ncbi:hypothetical protein D3C86_1777160 [compost metagenome]